MSFSLEAYRGWLPKITKPWEILAFNCQRGIGERCLGTVHGNCTTFGSLANQRDPLQNMHVWQMVWLTHSHSVNDMLTNGFQHPLTVNSLWKNIPYKANIYIYMIEQKRHHYTSLNLEIGQAARVCDWPACPGHRMLIRHVSTHDSPHSEPFRRPQRPEAMLPMW